MSTPRSQSSHSRKQARNKPSDNHDSIPEPHRRISLYDVVADRVGLNGFLPSEPSQAPDSLLPIGPEEYLLRRTRIGIPGEAVDEAARVTDVVSNNSKERLPLPDSDTLKAIHAYAADFYRACNGYRMGNDHHYEGGLDSRSMDETALLAVGFLLEEAVREALGENGDMAFVEPQGREDGLEESKMTRYQIQGMVPLSSSSVASPRRQRQQEMFSEDEEDSWEHDQSPTKKVRL